MMTRNLFSLVLVVVLILTAVFVGCSKMDNPVGPQTVEPTPNNPDNPGGGGKIVAPPKAVWYEEEAGVTYTCIATVMLTQGDNIARPAPYWLVITDGKTVWNDRRDLVLSFVEGRKKELAHGSFWDYHRIAGVYSKFQVRDGYDQWTDPTLGQRYFGDDIYANGATFYYQLPGGNNASGMAISISVDPDGLLKSAVGSYRICGTFTNGWEELPSAGKSFYVTYNDEQHFVVTGEDGVPMTNLKVNGATPPTYAWLDGQYWFAVPFAFPRFTWLEKSQGWKNVQFTFATDVKPNISDMYFLGNCTTAYTKNPSTDGWQKLQMNKVGADSAYLTLANAVEIERHCNVIVVYDVNKEAWPHRWLRGNGTGLDHGTITRFPTGAVDTFTIDYIVRQNGTVETRGLHLLDGVVVEIKP